MTHPDTSNVTTSERIEATFAEVANMITAQVREGATTFTMPWHNRLAFPTNAETNKPYTGGNVFRLWAAADDREYTSHRWATYKQWRDLGCQVMKGERGTLCVFAGKSPIKDKTTGEIEGWRQVRSTFTLFAAEQVDGYDALPAVPTLSPEQRIEAAEKFFASLPAKTTYGGDRAAYRPTTDEIVMPTFEQFTSPEAFYCTLAHEYGHWTGHTSRLNRAQITDRHTEEYAAEELVAEFTAAFVCAHLGLASQPREDHAAYIGSWLRILEHDPQSLQTAASAASKATALLIDLAAPEKASTALAA